MQCDTKNMHTLTHAVIEDLQSAFQRCDHPVESSILSALVKVRTIHDLLPRTENLQLDATYEDLH